MINVDDIQIFIMTRNRPEYLNRAITSLLAQDAGIKEITVLDNSDTDLTQKMMASFVDSKVNYFRTEGKFGNYLKSKQLAKRKYLMLFHDDDVLHPGYISLAITHLNAVKNIKLICSWSHPFKEESEIQFSQLTENFYLFSKRKVFAQHMYLGEGIAFASAIYETKNYLETRANYQKFGKYNDWPFLVNSVGNGRAIILADSNLLFSRVHKNQDSSTRVNSLELHQIVRWDKFFHECFGIKKRRLNSLLNQRATRFSTGKYAFELENPKLSDEHYALLAQEFRLISLKLIKDKELYDSLDNFFYGTFIPLFMQKNLHSLSNLQKPRAIFIWKAIGLELSLFMSYAKYVFYEVKSRACKKINSGYSNENGMSI